METRERPPRGQEERWGPNGKAKVLAASVSRNGCRLHVRKSGAGEPVLLIHGTCARIWGDSERALAVNHRVIAYDRRSFGASSCPPGAAISEHARDAAAVLDESMTTGDMRAAGSAIIVGWSMGGIIALELALTRPDLVAGLVLLEPPFHAIRHPSFSMLRAVLFGRIFGAAISPRRGAEAFLGWALSRQSGGSDLDRMDETLREAALANGAAVVGELSTGTGEHIGATDLANIACPTRVLVGDDSDRVFFAAGERLVRQVPSATLTRVVGSGHCVQLDAPRAVVDAVTFVSRRGA